MSKAYQKDIPRSIDLSGLSDAQMMQKLVALIDEENSKPDAERDEEFLSECFELLAEIMPDEEKHSENELDSKLVALKSKAAFESTNDASESKRRIRIAAILAAALLIIAAAVSVTAMMLGDNDRIPFIPDDHYDYVTVYDGDVTASYISAEEYLKKENIDIFFPHGISDDLDVVSIYRTDHGNGEFELDFKFKNASVNMTVYNYDLVSHGAPDGANSVTFAGYTFGIVKNGSGYDAFMLTEKYAYVINAVSEEMIYEIITSLKQI